MGSLNLLKADKKQKVWQDYDRVHGIYSLEFDIQELHYSNYSGDSYISLDNRRIYFNPSIKSVFLGFILNTVIKNGSKITLIGRFTKSGKAVRFAILDEPYEQ